MKGKQTATGQRDEERKLQRLTAGTELLLSPHSYLTLASDLTSILLGSADKSGIYLTRLCDTKGHEKHATRGEGLAAVNTGASALGRAHCPLSLPACFDPFLTNACNVTPFPFFLCLVIFHFLRF